MHYVCIENNKVIGIQGYEPSVPSTVTVVAIADEQNQQIMAQTHIFDVISKTVVPVDSSILSQKEQEKANAVEREFLNSTDWQVMRHIRQKALGVPTSLTEAEYLALEQQRADAAARIR
jgi:hypothetical protein